ncbi:MAG: DUF805 domain-containing protein [Verrucomicrobiales bacterium]|nr:DUF805 domain-containing protein [Verrucomicrobiales bacterium]
MNWYLSVWKQYATFSGRARRREYWMFTLFNFIAAVLLVIADAAIGGTGTGGGTGWLTGIYGLAALIPGLAVTIRRLHDTGRSGWWILISFVPLIGGIILLVFLVGDSESGDNAYGPNPKALPLA